MVLVQIFVFFLTTVSKVTCKNNNVIVQFKLPWHYIMGQGTPSLYAWSWHLLVDLLCSPHIWTNNHLSHCSSDTGSMLAVTNLKFTYFSEVCLQLLLQLVCSSMFAVTMKIFYGPLLFCLATKISKSNVGRRVESNLCQKGLWGIQLNSLTLETTLVGWVCPYLSCGRCTFWS